MAHRLTPRTRAARLPRILACHYIGAMEIVPAKSPPRCHPGEQASRQSLWKPCPIVTAWRTLLGRDGVPPARWASRYPLGTGRPCWSSWAVWGVAVLAGVAVMWLLWVSDYRKQPETRENARYS